MPQLQPALLAFGKLIGVMDATGGLQFMWFLDPLNNTFNGLADNRQHLLELIQALQAPSGGALPDKADFNLANHLVWVPINITSGLDAGLVWNDNSPSPLQLALGAKIAIGAKLDLGVTAQLIKVTSIPGGFPNQIAADFGKFRVAGTLPVPDFINSAAVDIGINPSANPVVNVGLDIVQAPGNERHFTIPNPNMVWDCGRLAVFVIRAWVKSQKGVSFGVAAGAEGLAFDAGSPAGPANFFSRVDDHLFPMLGADAGPGDPIQPFPLVDNNPGQAPVFTPWQNSVLFKQGATGPLTFLWHLRALITGNESKDLFTGSYFFPLVGDPSYPIPVPLPLPPPLNQFGSHGKYESTPHPKSIFLGITTEADNSHNLVVDLHNGSGQRQRIPLASMNGSCIRPSLPALADPAWTELTNFVNSFHSFQAGDTTIEVSVDPNNALAFTLFTETVTGAGPFNGNYRLQLVFKPGDPVAFRMNTPVIPHLEMPPVVTPADAASMFVGILTWILGTAGIDQATDAGQMIQQLLGIISYSIEHGSLPDMKPLLGSLIGLIGANGVIDFGGGPLSIGISQGAIEPTLTVGPFKPGDLGGLPIHIGKLEAKAGVNSSNGALSLAQVSLFDLRFGKGAGADAGSLVGSLLPDMRQVKGFTLAVAVDMASPQKFRITGGGKIPLQETIGPLELAGLLVDFKNNSMKVGIDLSFKLAVINVTAYELGVEFPFSNAAPTPFLHGLGLKLDMSAVKLAGMFAQVKTGPNTSDYVGGAVVSVVDMFQLSAIGGYTQLAGGKASLFIFASLVAPIGGPPWFFITGIAGGFGYNRTLPPPGLLTKHPFIQVMRGDLDVSGSNTEALTKLSSYFTAVEGEHWVAAGIQFTAFGFINGKLVVSIAFGNKFSVQVLGLAAFGIQSIAYFELGIEASGDDTVFKLKAGLSKNSYIIHPDIMSLTGDFGLGIWHGGPNAGDFVISIGGYHPYFKKPEHYDDLNRVAVHCVVYGFLRLSVECFFACTPQALMAGASVTLAAEFAGIGCGLDVYIDVFIRWDPFFIQARMGVALWFEFFGRHEISVDLEIWTPKFGGTATIDLAIVSFDVDFGTPLDAPPPPELYQFITKQLAVPAASDYKKAVVPAYNTDEQSGLFRVDFIAGRTTAPPDKSSKQEGVGTPLPVMAEFAFAVKTRLPLNHAQVVEPGQPALQGQINAPLCELYHMNSSFFVTFTNLNLPPKIQEYMKDLYPAANFGEKVETAQSGARQAVGKVDPSKPALPLWDGYRLRCEAQMIDSPPSITAKAFEDSVGPEEEYPLPLGIPGGGPPPLYMTPMSKLKLQVGAQYPVLQLSSHRRSSRQEADLLITNAKPRPLKVLSRSAALQRFPIAVRLRGLTVANPPADAPVIGVPSSPLRRSELYAVSFRSVVPKSPIDLRRRRLKTLSRAGKLQTKWLTPTEGATGSFQTTFSLPEYTAQILDLEGDSIKAHRLVFSGIQTVRAIFLGAGEDFLSEVYVKGTATVTAPARARRVALIGEGAWPPVAPASSVEQPRTSTVPASTAVKTAVTRTTPTTPIPRVTPPTASENIGIEHDTTLTALGRRTFAAHGCVIESRSRTGFAAMPLDAVPGFEVLRSATTFRICFPAVDSGAALVFVVTPLIPQPGVALEEIRWMSVDASLTDLTTIVGPDSTAFVMPVKSAGPWILEIDLGRKWRLNQVVVCTQTARDMVNSLKARIEQDLLDDRFQKSSEMSASSITLEVAQ